MPLFSVNTLSRRATVLLAAAAVAGASAVAVAVPAAAQTLSFGRYVPVSPVRVIDSRAAGLTPLGPNQSRTLDLTDLLPGPTTAVVLNLTAVNSTSNSYLTMWPANSTRPTASNLQTAPGETRSVSVTVAVDNTTSNDRLVNVYNNSGTTDFVVDLFGYYAPGNSPNPGASFYPIAPQRALDTRTTGGPVTSGQTRQLALTSTDNDVSLSGVSAVAVNITAVAPRSGGYLTAWNGAGAAPTASNVNFATGRNTANFAVVPVTCTNENCTTFSIGLRASASTDVLVDVVGFYAESFQLNGRGGYFVPIDGANSRIIDTRSAKPFGALGARAVGSASTSSTGEIPLIAVNATVTAVRPTTTTYLTTWPTGLARPATSTLNALGGQVLANATQIGVGGENRAISVYNNAGVTNVVVDVNGGFVSDNLD